MRFVLSIEGDTLSTVARRICSLESEKDIAKLRRRLIEINPHLPERRAIPAGTFVFLPKEIEGQPTRGGRELRDVTSSVLGEVLTLLQGVDEALARQAREESAHHDEQEELVADPELRKAARTSPELAERLKRLSEAIDERRQRTKALELFSRSAAKEAAEDLAALSELVGETLQG
jgi:hypothetical protein